MFHQAHPRIRSFASRFTAKPEAVQLATLYHKGWLIHATDILIGALDLVSETPPLFAVLSAHTPRRGTSWVVLCDDDKDNVAPRVHVFTPFHVLSISFGTGVSARRVPRSAFPTYEDVSQAVIRVTSSQEEYFVSLRVPSRRETQSPWTALYPNWIIDRKTMTFREVNAKTLFVAGGWSRLPPMFFAAQHHASLPDGRHVMCDGNVGLSVASRDNEGRLEGCALPGGGTSTGITYFTACVVGDNTDWIVVVRFGNSPNLRVYLIRGTECVGASELRCTQREVTVVYIPKHPIGVCNSGHLLLFDKGTTFVSLGTLRSLGCAPPPRVPCSSPCAPTADSNGTTVTVISRDGKTYLGGLSELAGRWPHLARAMRSGMVEGQTHTIRVDEDDHTIRSFLHYCVHGTLSAPLTVGKDPSTIYTLCQLALVARLYDMGDLLQLAVDHLCWVVPVASGVDIYDVFHVAQLVESEDLQARCIVKAHKSPHVTLLGVTFRDQLRGHGKDHLWAKISMNRKPLPAATVESKLRLHQALTFSFVS